MKEKLRAHLESLFAGAPKTRKAEELKEELLSNLYEKYDDLIARGLSEDEAYKAAAAGIGDVEELIAALRRDNVFDSAAAQRDRQRSAMRISVAVGLYILSVAVLILCAMFNPVTGGEIGVVAMFVIAAVATGILVYNGLSRPHYSRRDDTVVEEFKEWKSGRSDKDQLRKTVSSILWPLVVAVYLLVSFLFDAWAISWIIFIIGVAVDRIVAAVLLYRNDAGGGKGNGQ